MRIYKTIPLKDRFFSKVEKTSTCWLWKGGLTKGYGTFAINTSRKNRVYGRAHRVSWELINGPIPSDKHVLHKCDNPKCVNPKHLFLGSNMDNIQDCIQKKRKYNYTQIKFCKNGHKLDNNIHVQPSGVNRCKTCLKIWARRTYLNRKNKSACK